MRHLPCFLPLAAVVSAALASAPVAAEPVENPDGTTNLPAPRFVSLKSNSAMMRAGPEERFPILWEYKRKGLPMEVLREYKHWRRVRDPDGTIGWMQKALLTGTRTGFISGEARTLYTSPDMQARVAWRIAPGAVVTITLCENVWCRVSNGGRSGYILRNHFWGSYRDEAISG